MEMFDPDWMEEYRQQWNGAPEVAGALADAEFSTTIGVGYLDKPDPEVYVRVEMGKIVHSGKYDGTDLGWDMRAKPEQWEKWQSSPPTMMTLGKDVAFGKLKFLSGDFPTMIKNPALAGPFVKSFGLMCKIGA